MLGVHAHFLEMTMLVAAAEAKKRPWCRLRWASISSMPARTPCKPSMQGTQAAHAGQSASSPPCAVFTLLPAVLHRASGRAHSRACTCTRNAAAAESAETHV